MDTIYLILVIFLFFLALSDLVVGVANDAVNFLNSAVGSRASTFKVIMAVAALGVLIGATFSSGMMEVARKGIFNPQFFYFDEIIILFLAVMLTDVLLLDAFNTFGLPTSTTVSIVFELLGAAVAVALIKVYNDPDALPLYEYINSARALGIISGILLSIVIAFTFGAIIQYLSRLLFSFDFERRMRRYGALWGGLAVSIILYFILVKGIEGASFLSEEDMVFISDNSMNILLLSFAGTTLILQILIWVARVNILKFIVLFGTFALAMAFAGNDLVNFIGVPLAGYNAYLLFVENGGAAGGGLLMEGLAGKVPTPTLLLVLSGLVMVITLYTSRKARSVIKTSLDLGRQDSGYERFPSSMLSRSIVRNFMGMAQWVDQKLPGRLKRNIAMRFDQKPFAEMQSKLGTEAPVFDLIRASVTLVVSSSLIAFGTALKLPLSTTYVTFMVFMGASLADGAWGRESAVYRITGVFSVIGGWFFTAFSAFTISFILAAIIYFGGIIAMGVLVLLSGILIYRSHRLHNKRVEEEAEHIKSLASTSVTKGAIVDTCSASLIDVLEEFGKLMDDNLKGLASEDLQKLKGAQKKLDQLYRKIEKLKGQSGAILEHISEDALSAGYHYTLVTDYMLQMAQSLRNIVKPSYNHIDNNHKPLTKAQREELKAVQEILKARLEFALLGARRQSPEPDVVYPDFQMLLKAIRFARKNQIKRIKNHEIGTRNSVLFLNLLSEYRNLGLFTDRMIAVFSDMVNNIEED
jgi:phosphate/sulfate permease